MIRSAHRIAGVIGFFTILTFWTSTVVTELFGSQSAIIAVKLAIPWGFIVLVPALAIAGGTGFRMAGKSRAPKIVRKKRRMPIIAGNGILVLIPSALFLAWLASRGELGATFYAVQAIELVAGALNLTLMGLNIRDGMRMTGRLAAA